MKKFYLIFHGKGRWIFRSPGKALALVTLARLTRLGGTTYRLMEQRV